MTTWQQAVLIDGAAIAGIALIGYALGDELGLGIALVVTAFVFALAEAEADE